jgi:ADP-heptose:LPS heptosyltransferase
MKNGENVLVYHIGSLGDTIISVPAIKAIRRHYGPRARLTLLHDKQRNGIVAASDVLFDRIGIDDFISYDYSNSFLKKCLSLLQLFILLKRKNYDGVIYLLPSERTSKQIDRDRLFFKLCSVKKQIGFSAFDPAILYPIEPDGSPGRVKNEALFRLERLKNDGIDISIEENLSRQLFIVPEIEREKAHKWLIANGRNDKKILVALCPGAKQPANLWPEERFLEIGKRLLGCNLYDLLIIGGKAESNIGARLVKLCGGGINATGQSSILHSAALLSHCAFCIGLDTGTTHLAAALGCPCIALYGGKDHPGYYEPLGRGHIILRKDISCAACRLIGENCPLPDHPCMNGISVEMVWQAVLKMKDKISK